MYSRLKCLPVLRRLRVDWNGIYCQHCHPFTLYQNTVSVTEVSGSRSLLSHSTTLQNGRLVQVNVQQATAQSLLGSCAESDQIQDSKEAQRARCAEESELATLLGNRVGK